METTLWSEIRRLHFAVGLFKKEIARKLGLSVRTVRRALKRETPPHPITRDRDSKLDPFKDRIQSLLIEYPRLSAVRVFDEIRGVGFDGGITILRHYLRNIRPTKHEAFVRIETDPGDEAQVDWGLFGDYFGCGRILSCFVFVLSHSRMLTLEWTLSQKTEDFMRAHKAAFNFFGGVPQKILYDNLKSVVCYRRGPHIQFNERFMGFAGTHLFEPVACNVRRGNEKGKVERVIGYIRDNFFYGRSFRDLDDLRTQSRRWRDDVANQRLHRVTRQKPIERFEFEKDKLRKLPDTPFDCDTIITATASKQCRLTFDSNTYTVPSLYALIPLTLRANDHEVRIFKQDRLIASHLRSWQKHRDIEDPKHLEAILEEKQRASQAKQKDIFLSLGELAEKFLLGLIQTQKSLPHELKKINALITAYGKTEILQAIETALPFNAFGSEYLKNIILQNLTRRGQVPPLSPVESTNRPELMEISVQERDLEQYPSGDDDEQSCEEKKS